MHCIQGVGGLSIAFYPRRVDYHIQCIHGRVGGFLCALCPRRVSVPSCAANPGERGWVIMYIVSREGGGRSYAVPLHTQNMDYTGTMENNDRQ